MTVSFKTIADLSANIEALCQTELRRLPLFREGPPRDPTRYADTHQIGTIFGSSPRHGGIATEDAEEILRIVSPMAEVIFEIGFDENSENKALPWLFVKKALTDTRVCGAERTAKVWAPQMKLADARCIGDLYVAKADAHPTIIKIGFSTQVPVRLRQLTRQVGSPVRLIKNFPATQIHEYALHQCLGRRRIASEWYPHDIVPAWLTGEPS